MRTYTVHRKKGASLPYEAHSYTEDAGAARIYFHKKEDKSDRDSFVMISDVSGIDEAVPPVSYENPETQLLSSPALELAMRRMLERVEERRKSAKKPAP
jgi:hypothetical protein